jgi:hypothetical protein
MRLYNRTTTTPQEYANVNEETSVSRTENAQETAEPEAGTEASGDEQKLTEADEQIILNRLRELGYVE